MEREKYWNYCCICGQNFKDIYPGNDITRLPNKDGTYTCVPCANIKERQEILTTKSPAYITFYQKWDKLPKQLKFYIPFKQAGYIKAGKLYHVIIYED